jgi:phytoene dehydrogenase-like protein
VSDAIVVGSGPNGLAGAVELARNGLNVTVLEAEPTIGGGTRSSELTIPGLVHDECSAFHPMACSSPAFAEFGLERHGLAWLWPEVDLAHPLDSGEAGVMLHSIEATAEDLAADGRTWKRFFGAPSRAFEALGEDVMGPMLHFPKHPLGLVRFGVPALAPATLIGGRFQTPEARALFGGVAAHSFSRLSRPLSASVGMALICACHAFGWPVARGGSQSIADALASALAEHGGKIETGRRVASLDELPAADVVLLDLAPGAVARIAGSRLPGRVARAYRRYRHGPGAFKLDLAVEGGIPWVNDAARHAGTVHAVGTFDELRRGEDDVNAGRMPDRPLVLVGQQYLADPGRSAGDVHPVWTYAHVPSGYDGDATEAIIGQIERFAPGVRERIVATATRGPAELEARNANYIGGDIITGANTPWQIVMRPRTALNPYATGIPGVYMCSAATPPGAGAHGMNGYNAARVALAKLGG